MTKHEVSRIEFYGNRLVLIFAVIGGLGGATFYEFNHRAVQIADVKVMNAEVKPKLSETQKLVRDLSLLRRADDMRAQRKCEDPESDYPESYCEEVQERLMFRKVLEMESAADSSD